MHAILFGMKRAFQASLRVMRRPLEPFGLTPARFDMLWCIHQLDVDDEACPVLQSDVRKRLGVTAPTVTRMLRSLEALGLVQRERDIFDRRQIVVGLTREGLERILTAYAHFVERKAAERAIRSAMREGRPFREQPPDEESASCAMGRFARLLDRIRQGFRDRADLHYGRHRGAHPPGSCLGDGSET